MSDTESHIIIDLGSLDATRKIEFAAMQAVDTADMSHRDVVFQFGGFDFEVSGTTNMKTIVDVYNYSAAEQKKKKESKNLLDLGELKAPSFNNVATRAIDTADMTHRTVSFKYEGYEFVVDGTTKIGDAATAYEKKRRVMLPQDAAAKL